MFSIYPNFAFLKQLMIVGFINSLKSWEVNLKGMWKRITSGEMQPKFSLYIYLFESSMQILLATTEWVSFH